MQRTVDTYLLLPRRRYFSAIELHAVAIGSIAAAVLIVGYGFNFTPLQTIFPGFPQMRPVTAGSIMFLSLSCLLSLRESKRSRIMSTAVAAGVIAYILWRLAVSWEQLADPLSVYVPIQGTAISVILAGLALLIINLAPKYGLAAGIIALTAAAPALYRIIGLILFWGAPSDNNSPLNSMGLHTSILIVWFMTVCVLMHPRLAFAQSVLQASLRGRVLRRALPFVIIVPIAACALSLLLALAAGWPEEMLFALVGTLSAVMGAFLIWWLSSIVETWQNEANAQASRLSRANEALEQYASSAAHDLKAPARHVMLYSELLEDAIQKGDTATALRHARSIRDSAAEMPVMIEGMLDYSRSGFTRISLTQNSLSELVQAAAAQNATDLKAAEATVSVVNEVKLLSDSTLITTVFQNLIANAIKNRRKDRQLAIRINALREDDVWRISVEDNGVGFDPEFAVVAFNPLARGIHTGGEGSGIGLSTCRNIIQSHGGEIRVDATFKGGARVEFTLPAAARKEA